MEIRNLLDHEMPLAMEIKTSCWPEELAGKAENTMKIDDEIEFWTNWKNTANEHSDIRLLLGAFEATQLMGLLLQVLLIQSPHRKMV